MSQSETPRVIAGSRRVRENRLFVNQTQHLQIHPPHHQSEAAPPPSPTNMSHTPPPSHHAPSRKQSHDQMRNMPELGEPMSTFTHADPPVFALPAYSNELGRLPLHGRMASNTQTHLSQAQTHAPLRDPWTNYWYAMPSSASTQVSERSEPTFHTMAGPSGAISHGLRYPPLAPQQQQHPRSHHASQGILMDGLSEMSSTTQGSVAGNIFNSTFSTQAHLSHLQARSPHLDPEANYCYTATAPEPTSHTGASGTSSSSGPHYPPAPASQQPYPHHHAPQGISGGEFPSASKASSVAQGLYGMDAAELATGMLFDKMGERAGYIQRTSTYGLGTMHSSFPGMGSGSMMSTPPQSSSGSSVEVVYRGMGMEAMPDHSGGHYQHQDQTVPRQQEQPASSYPFVDNDAVGVWLNAPAGFECVIFVSVFNLVHSFSPFVID